VLVVTEGSGAIVAETGAPVPVGRGSTVLVPHAAGPCALAGDFLAIRCSPAIERKRMKQIIDLLPTAGLPSKSPSAWPKPLDGKG